MWQLHTPLQKVCIGSYIKNGFYRVLKVIQAKEEGEKKIIKKNIYISPPLLHTYIQKTVHLNIVVFLFTTK